MKLGAALLVEPGQWGHCAPLAQAAEDAGWDYIFCAEGPYGGSNANSVVGSVVLGLSTERMTVGTCISIVDYRHAWAAAAACGNMRELVGERYVFGVGVSHPSINAPVGIHIEKPVTETRRYVTDMRRFAADMAWGQPRIWFAAVGPRMTALAGELGDGVIFHHVPLSLLESRVAILSEAAERAGRPCPVVAIYGRTAYSENRDESYELGREVTYQFLHLPVYQRLHSEAGFPEEVAQVTAAIERGDRAAAYEAITEELMDDYLLLGDFAAIRAKMDAFAARGIEVLLLGPLPVIGTPLRPRFEPLLNEFRIRNEEVTRFTKGESPHA